MQVGLSCNQSVPRRTLTFSFAKIFCSLLPIWASLSLVGAEVPMVSSSRHKLQVQDPAVGAQIVARGGKLVADYQGYKLYEVSSSAADLAAQPGSESHDDYNFILLNAAQLDTSRPEVQAMRAPKVAFQGKKLHLVQFAGPPLAAWHDALVAAGVQVVSYIPENAYLVYGDAQSLAQLQSLAATASYVQWEGAYADAYKIQPHARTTDASGNPRVIGTDEFAIQLVADTTANPATLQLIGQIQLATPRRVDSFQQYVNVIVKLDPATLTQLAAQPDVVSIQPYFPRKKFDERQDQIVAGNISNNVPSGPGYMNFLTSKGFTQTQFTTSGFAVDVTDSGIDNGTTSPNHPGVHLGGVATNASRVVYNRLQGFANPGSTLKGCDGHGTLNSHVIGGFEAQPLGFPHTDGAGYHYGLGVCPFVKLGSSVIFDPDFYTFPNLPNLQSQAYHDGARVSNNSWGASTDGDYDIDAQQYDALVRDAQPSGSTFPTAGNQEMVIVFAAGNDGPNSQTIGAPGVSKNVFTVGAAENVQAFGVNDGCGLSDSGADNLNDIIFFSSRGPCTDGRQKPDLVAPGTHVSGGVAQAANPAVNGTADSCFTANGDGVCGLSTGLFFPLGQQWYTVSSGTSHSTPCVAGGCALLRQYFINTYGSVPSPAMTKAYLMNSTRYLNGVSANDNFWSPNQGMGEMNLGVAFDGAQRSLRDELSADLFTASGQTRVFTGLVASSTSPFRVTLAWTDSPGSTIGNAYNNNLDLTVTVGGSPYKGNVFSKSNSITGGSADARNNVESVFLPPGVSGPYTITVTATSINSDGVPNNATPLDQDFAIVIYNSITVTPPGVGPIQPSSLTVLNGQSASFTVPAFGTAPLFYQWRQNGTNVPGATTNTISFASAQVTNSGAYTLVVTNSVGSITSAVGTLTVIATVPLPVALNNSNLTWVTDAPIPWYGQTNISHDGFASAQTWSISDTQSVSLRTSVTGPGTLSYWWKASSEAGADKLTFRYGGNDQAAISGEVDWEQRSFFLPAGSLSLEWLYAKSESGSAGQDRAWVDQVSYVAGPTLPFMLTQPLSTSSLGGAPVSFAASADGTPPLTYQWQFNNVDIPGATSTSYAIASPLPVNDGAYTLVASNAYGYIVSSNAYLGVVPLNVGGDNTFGQISVLSSATNAIAIAAGAWHSLAVQSSGPVIGWGNDADGQCDPPAGLGPVINLAGGGYHTIALKANHAVQCWGNNDDGQTNLPPQLGQVVAVAAGTWHSMALRGDGTIAAWGDNTWGQAHVPAGLNGIRAIAAGGSHNLALRTNGTVAAWGENTDANGFFAGQSIVPPNLSNVVAIGAGEYHSLAVKADGTVVTWGDDSMGQCDVPIGLTNVIAVAGGGSHTLALKRDGTVAAWGADYQGQCGFVIGKSNIVAIAAGSAHSLLLLGSSSAPPVLSNPSRKGNLFSVVVQTFSGLNYSLEYIDSVTSSNWTGLPSVPGNGTFQTLTDPNATADRRYYRVKQQ